MPVYSWNNSFSRYRKESCSFLHHLAWASVFAIGNIPFAALADTDDTGTSGNAPFSVTVDQSTSQADPTHISPVSFTVVFSTAIDPTTFTASDIKITGTSSGAIAAPPTTLDNITWDVSVFATSPGTIIATLPADAVTDLALNGNTSSTSTDNLVVFDNLAPTVIINQAVTQQDPTNVNPINFTVTFSKPIDPATFVPSDLTVGGTAVGAIIGVPTTPDNIIWNVPVSGLIGSGTVIATLAANSVKDPVGNNNKASTSTDNVVLFSFGAPSVVINQASAQSDPTTTQPINFSVVFNNPIDPATFSPGDLIIGGTSKGGAISNLTTSDNITWSVGISGVSSSGTIVLSMGSGRVKDFSGIDNIASTSVDNQVSYNFGSCKQHYFVNQLLVKKFGISFSAAFYNYACYHKCAKLI